MEERKRGGKTEREEDRDEGVGGEEEEVDEEGDEKLANVGENGGVGVVVKVATMKWESD